MFEQWRYEEAHERYVGTQTIKESLPSGLFQLFVNNAGEPMIVKADTNDEDLYIFKKGNNRKIYDEVNSFWNNRDRYKQLGVTHKRGILLHGSPGCGKTAIISLCMKNVITRGGICLAMAPNVVGHFKQGLPLLQQIEKNRDVMVIMEDLEIYRQCENELLEVMDGTSSLGDGILYLATTNYLDKIPTRFSHRPSRFDTLLEVDLPSEDERFEYLVFVSERMFKNTQKQSQVQKWAELTKGFSIAQLKELVIAVVIHKHKLRDSLERLSILSPEVVASREKEDGPGTMQELRKAYKLKYSTDDLWEDIDEELLGYDDEDDFAGC